MKFQMTIAALVLAMPALAQAPTESRPSAPVVQTEKMWKIETSGLGG